MVEENVSSMTDTDPQIEVVAPNAKLDPMDQMALEVAKANRKTALAEAQTALAKNEASELQYKNAILQVYVKYGLNTNDAISETGEILKNGATAQKV